MGLIRDILFWLLLKCWRIVIALLIVFVAIVGYSACARYWQMAKEDMSSYEDRIIQAKATIVKELDVKAMAYQKMEDLNRWKPWWTDPRRIPWSWDYDYWNGVYQGADAAAKRATQSKDELESGLSEAKTGKWWLIGIAERAWARALSFSGLIVFTIVFVPGLWKAFWFYIVAPIASKARPIRLAEAQQGIIEVDEAVRVQEIELKRGSTVCTRGNWVSAYPSSGVKKGTRLLWDWSSPLISYGSGMRELTEWQVMEKEPQVLKLSSGSDPNLKISKLRINSQTGLAVRPGSIVAIAGNLKITTRWRLGSIHSWISGRLRYVILSGEGVLYLSGYGDLKSEQAQQRRSDHLLIAHDPATPFKVVRTEGFWQFLRGNADLYDLEFCDQGLVIYQAAVPRTSGTKVAAHERIQSWLDLLLKPLGF